MQGDSDIFSIARYRAMYHYTYLTTPLLSLQPRPVPELMGQALGPIAIDRYWRVYYDPEALQAEGVEQAAGMIMHELHHVLEAHFARAELIHAEPVTANLAQDAAINGPLRGMHVALPDWVVYPHTFKFPEGLLWEDYYEKLQKQQAPKKGQSGATRHNCGSGAHGQPQPWEDGSPSDESPGVTEQEGHLLQRLTAEAIKEHIKQHGRGSVPETLDRWADEQLRPPKVPWQRELSSLIRAGVSTVAGAIDFSYQHISRRASAVPGVILPALRAPVPEIAVILDLSASMGGEQVVDSLSETAGILRTMGYLPSVRVMSVDTEAHTCQRVFDTKQIQLIGGGGTDMAKGIEQAAALRPRPNVIIVLSDLISPWPKEKPKGIQVIVVGIGEDAAAYRAQVPSWARVLMADTPSV